MNWYEAKQEARRQRLEDYAAKKRREAENRLRQGRLMFDAIPFGQPILVGHYSEKRDRNYRNRAANNMRKGFAGLEEAGNLEARAASVGTGGISSDDPEAVRKLKEELAEKETAQAKMVAANAAWRKAGNKAGRQADGTWVDKPYTYEITNNNGNMRRIRLRIAELERNATRETKETERADGVTVIQNAEINRLQIKFPGKPPKEHRQILKQYGFRWSPTEGAWQRQLHGGDHHAQWALEAIDKLKGGV